MSDNNNNNSKEDDNNNNNKLNNNDDDDDLSSNLALNLPSTSSTISSSSSSSNMDTTFRISVSRYPTFQIKSIKNIDDELNQLENNSNNNNCLCTSEKNDGNSAVVVESNSDSNNTNTKCVNKKRRLLSSTLNNDADLSSNNENNNNLDTNKLISNDFNNEKHDDDSIQSNESKRQKSDNTTINPTMSTSSSSVITNSSTIINELIVDDDDEDLDDIRLNENYNLDEVTKKINEKAKEKKNNMTAETNKKRLFIDDKTKQQESRAATSNDDLLDRTNGDNVDNDDSNGVEGATPTQTESPSTSNQRSTIVVNDEYWQSIFSTNYYKTNSLKFSDLLRREYGETRPNEFMYKAMSNLEYVRKMKLTKTLDFHDGCVNALNYNRIGTLLISGSDDYQVCMWDWSRGQSLFSFQTGHKSNVFQCKFMPFVGDTQIVTSARDGQVRLALISTSGKLLGTKRVAKHLDACHKISIENDSPNIFLSCGEDGVVYEIDLRAEKPINILTVKSDNDRKVQLYSISSNPLNTDQFVVCGRDQYVRIYDKRRLAKHEPGIVKKLWSKKLEKIDKASITSAVYNYNGTEIVASYSDDDIYLFDAQANDITDALHHYQGHRNSDTIKGVNFFGSQSDFIVSGSDCGRLFFWEKTSEKIVQALKADNQGVVNVLEPHPSFPIIATSGLDHEVKVWSPINSEPNDLRDLADIIKENQQQSIRNFSLSTFEFELLLLLMHRPSHNPFFNIRTRNRHRHDEDDENNNNDEDSSSSSSSDDNDDDNDNDNDDDNDDDFGDFVDHHLHGDGDDEDDDNGGDRLDDCDTDYVDTDTHDSDITTFLNLIRDDDDSLTRLTNATVNTNDNAPASNDNNNTSTINNNTTDLVPVETSESAANNSETNNDNNNNT